MGIHNVFTCDVCVYDNHNDVGLGSGLGLVTEAEDGGKDDNTELVLLEANTTIYNDILIRARLIRARLFDQTIWHWFGQESLAGRCRLVRYSPPLFRMG